ncbi:hypothetical protein D5H75_16535 [Bailinhaonella thermotolerans]|uniref:Uncharacterized protein n=1 Tax=Bailinhaonella thermotolerans TaxID=1070861 RepID=A0A3A4BCV6_9ACTN|nr:hypothetical protein D5H75_16535 [Bailinhaonella thermotolerans]
MVGRPVRAPGVDGGGLGGGGGLGAGVGGGGGGVRGGGHTQSDQDGGRETGQGDEDAAHFGSPEVFVGARCAPGLHH